MQILTKHWTVFYQEIQKINKIEECIYSGSPSLVKISKELSKNETIGFISKLISKINFNLNIGKKMSPEQIFSVSELILKEYYYYNLTEINMCLNRGFLGKYGQIYDRFDGMIIFEWLKSYSNERDEAIINKNSNDKKEYEKCFNEILLPILKNVENQFKIENKLPKVVAKLENDSFFQDCMKEFDKLYREKEYVNEQIRTVSYKGKILNQEDFIQEKLKEI